MLLHSIFKYHMSNSDILQRIQLADYVNDHKLVMLIPYSTSAASARLDISPLPHSLCETKLTVSEL